ncbi:MAG: hypothetical protein WBE76_18675, partial [Terracidiphilus sp.]
ATPSIAPANLLYERQGTGEATSDIAFGRLPRTYCNGPTRNAKLLIPVSPARDHPLPPRIIGNQCGNNQEHDDDGGKNLHETGTANRDYL